MMTNWKVPYTLCSSMDDRHLTTPISRGRGRGGRGKARRGNHKYAAVSHRSQVRPVLESNWERYGEEGLLTADVTKAKTYEDLLQAAGEKAQTTCIAQARVERHGSSYASATPQTSRPSHLHVNNCLNQLSQLHPFRCVHVFFLN